MSREEDEEEEDDKEEEEDEEKEEKRRGRRSLYHQKSKKDSKNHCLSKNDPKNKSPEVLVFGGVVHGRFGFSKYVMIVV